MTTLATIPTIDVDARRVPPLGGLNPTLVGLELRRVLRNRRTLVFAAVFPIAMLFVFGSDNGGQDPDVAAFVMASMALYGGATISAATGASVATERALGWSRQLRLTPLHPAVYVGVKAVVALVAGALSIVAVNVAGRVRGVDLPLSTTLEAAGLTLVCVLTFAALGVFVGYLVPGENAMQVIGPGLALLSFLGGVFIPVSQYSELVRHIAYWTPMYGVAEVARAPITHELPWWAVVNWAVWLGLFVVGAAWRMSRDTARV